MKKLLIIFMILGLMLTGCKQKKEEEITPAGVAISDNYRGYFYEKNTGRGVLNLTNLSEDGTGDIIIDWGSSAFETEHWEMKVNYDGKDTLNYSNALHSKRTYDSSGKYEENIIYEDGKGYFKLVDDSLIWHSESDEIDDTEFVRELIRDESSQEANPSLTNIKHIRIQKTLKKLTLF